MKKLITGFGAAMLLSLAAIGTPAQAQTGGHFVRTQVYVVPAPPPRHYQHRHYPPPPPHYHPGYQRGHGYYHRDRYGGGRRHGYRDSDRDGVPNRYDRRPNNPYRY